MDIEAEHKIVITMSQKDAELVARVLYELIGVISGGTLYKKVVDELYQTIRVATGIEIDT